MNIEPTNEADVVCKDLIGEAAPVLKSEFPGFSGGLDDLWYKIQEALKLDMCTTDGEDAKAMDLLQEVFEEARYAAEQDGFASDASEYVDYKQLWEKLMAVIGVKV